MEVITKVKQDDRNCYITVNSSDLEVGDILVLTLHGKEHYFRIIESNHKRGDFVTEHTAKEIGYYNLFRKHHEPLKDISMCNVGKVTDKEEINKINVQSTYI